MEHYKNYFDANLKRWNELVDINAKSKFYDLEGFKAGKTSLLSIEREELTEVKGKTLLHLQCHFGMDTLSWAREGAIVTGIDFSENAITLARTLSEELEIPASFVHSNIYDLPNVLDNKFDIVFTSYGVIGWLPDLYKWAEIIDNFLKAGGIFYIIENHPFGNLIDEKHKNEFNIGYDYFNEGKPYRFDEVGSYVDTNAMIKNKTTYDWFHPIGDIINALLQVNFKLLFLHEFPFSFFQIHPDMKRKEDGYWEFQTFKHSIPMMFSLKAKKY
ncbi:MAG: class I SAM-dependent methyltransferase [Promethearchaeota archaeon]|nr:MAG: class I SAM-dependent methyltransferase [Candidatus Lokiarchaeota archaeon]